MHCYDLPLDFQQNKEAEAKEELKRRAKQLEMQRREQQRRTAGGVPGGSYMGGGVTGYSPVPRFEAPDVSASSASRIANTTSTPARAPAFKGSGMKLGSKKTKQAELLDALGGNVLTATAAAEISQPVTPTVQAPPTVQKVSGRGSLPEVDTKRCVTADPCLASLGVMILYIL